jgi:hypothetical protein
MLLDINSLNTNELLAIDMARQGCVSGQLWEWPILRIAFEKLNLPCYGTMFAYQARNMAILVYLAFPSTIQSKLR